MEKYTALEQALNDHALVIITDQITTRRELNRIDACFVEKDADGIAGILKKTEEDSGLSSMSRLRIVSECNLALLDLRTESIRRQIDSRAAGVSG